MQTVQVDIFLQATGQTVRLHFRMTLSLMYPTELIRSSQVMALQVQAS